METPGNPSPPKHPFAIVIPVYNHHQTVVQVVREALELKFPVFVVDDGSTDSTAQKLREISGIHTLHHRCNQGKGAALMTGFKAAANVAQWAIAMDADGQHHPRDAWALTQAVQQNQRAIVIGKRDGMRHQHVPWTSRFGREFSNFWVWASGGPRLSDSQSGFRIYPLPDALHLDVKARRFQFEVEILIKAFLKRIPIIEVPIGVTYNPGAQRISHFHPLFDFLRNSGTFSRLIFHRILRLRSNLRA